MVGHAIHKYQASSVQAVPFYEPNAALDALVTHSAAHASNVERLRLEYQQTGKIDLDPVFVIRTRSNLVGIFKDLNRLVHSTDEPWIPANQEEKVLSRLLQGTPSNQASRK
jgi:hypothetical protein